MESLCTIGVVMFVFLILPTLDVIKGAMLTNNLCILPAILAIIAQIKNVERPNFISIILDWFAVFIQLAGLGMWTYLEYEGNKNFWLIPIAAFLVSVGWWENYINPKSNNWIMQTLFVVKRDLLEKNSRYVVYVAISIWKIILTLGSTVLFLYLTDGLDIVKNMFNHFSDSFNDHYISIVRDKTYTNGKIDDEKFLYSSYTSGPIWIVVLHIVLTYTCYAFAKFACKVCIQSFSFALPLSLVVPSTVSFLLAVSRVAMQDKCKLTNFYKGFQYMFWYTDDEDAFTFTSEWHTFINLIIWGLTILSQTWIGIHIWFSTSPRLASTEKLFVLPMFNATVVDQSLILNRRRIDDNEEQELAIISDAELAPEAKKDDLKESNVAHLYESVTESMPVVPHTHNSDHITRIYMCATMWHETAEEMMQMLKSVMRVDADQCARRQAQEWFNLHPSLTDYYEVEGRV